MDIFGNNNRLLRNADAPEHKSLCFKLKKWNWERINTKYYIWKDNKGI